MADPVEIQIEPLADHPRGAFSCGVVKIENFFRNNARKAHEAYAQRIFVAKLTGSENPIGFYALTMMAYTVGMSDEADTKFSRHDSIPTIYMPMIARDKALSPPGFGAVLMEDAFKRCVAVRNDVGAYALTLHALNEQVATIYENLGFHRFSDDKHDLKNGENIYPAMYAPLTNVAASLKAAEAARLEQQAKGILSIASADVIGA